MLGGRAGVTKHPEVWTRHQGEARGLWFVPGVATYLRLEQGEQRQWVERKTERGWRGLGHKGLADIVGPLLRVKWGTN